MDPTSVILSLLLWLIFSVVYALVVMDDPTRRITRRRYYLDVFICWPGILFITIIETLLG